jgi:hypothetical protein
MMDQVQKLSTSKCNTPSEPFRNELQVHEMVLRKRVRTKQDGTKSDGYYIMRNFLSHLILLTEQKNKVMMGQTHTLSVRGKNAYRILLRKPLGNTKRWE